jgi:hypothetical protein
MREIRSSGSVEGVMSNRDSYSDFLLVVSAVCGTCLPGGCAVAKLLPRRVDRICGRGPKLALGEESTPRRGA